MNIGPDTFEKSIAASCIQLAQAYSVTKKISIEKAKEEVGNYLKSLSIYFNDEDVYDPTSHFRTAVQLALKNCENKQDKAYLELLKLRDSLN